MTRSFPRSSAAWRSHYERNACIEPPIPWENGSELTVSERHAISASVREFQLGESSEGRNLLVAAKAYALRTGDEDYVPAIQGFIREEQRHAQYLGRFLAAEDVPLARRSWADSVFRLLRRGADLEATISVLLTAEIIAQVYYRALYHATRSSVLQAICKRILDDEAQHVRFQAERLALLRFTQGKGRIRIARAMQRLLFVAAVLVVWLKHVPVMKRGGMPWSIYWRSCGSAFAAASETMRPELYWSSGSGENELFRCASAAAERDGAGWLTP